VSEAAVAELEVPTTPVSEVSTPVSDTPAEPLSVPEEAAPDAAGAETPAPTEPETRTPDSYDLTELNQLYKDGKLNDRSLVERRERLVQADNDRRAADQRRTAELRQAAEQRAQSLANARQWAGNEIATILQGFDGTDNGQQLTNLKVNQVIDAYHRFGEQVHQAPIQQALDAAIIDAVGDGAEIRERLAHPQTSWAGKLEYLLAQVREKALEEGKTQGYGDGAKVFKTTKEYEAEVKRIRDEAFSEFKAANPNASPPKGVVPSASKSMTPDQADAAYNRGDITSEQWHQYTAVRRREESN
jgi:hypothetical protein